MLSREIVERVRQLARNPKFSIGSIGRITGVSEATLRSNWPKKYQIRYAYKVRLRNDKERRLQKILMLRARSGITLIEMTKAVYSHGRVEYLIRFCEKHRIVIEGIPRVKKQAIEICGRCKKKPTRAQGFCRSCHQWARYNGLIETGKKCKATEQGQRCKLFTYGTADYCHSHLFRRVVAMIPRKHSKRFVNKGRDCRTCLARPAFAQGQCRLCYSRRRSKKIAAALKKFRSE